MGWKSWAAVVVLSFIFFAALLTACQAHDWYPTECCSGRDCSQSPPGEVVWTPEGWVIAASGEIIGHDDKRIRRDGKATGIHRCSYGGRPEARTICLFIPELEG